MAPPRTRRAASAFPSDLYSKYKHATEFFLTWLLHAGVGVTTASDVQPSKKTKKKKSKPKRRMALDVYDAIVSAVASDLTTLSSTAQEKWPHALAACETAITLRSRVAQFFPTVSVDSYDSHGHFLERLRSWFTTLKDARRQADSVSQQYSRPTARDKRKDKDKARAKAKAKTKAVDFSNYYEVLELPEDYFSPDKDHSEATAQSADAKKSAAERQRMFDEAFENELNAELSFLLMELDELLEAVHNAFLDVKLEKRAVPGHSLGYSMMTVIRDRIPEDEFKGLWDQVWNEWVAAASDKLQKVQPAYVPRSIIVELVWMANVLEPFIMRIPPPKLSDANMKVMDESHNGTPYDKEKTRYYPWPSMDPMPLFFGRQLAILYSIFVVERYAGIPLDMESLEGWFRSYFWEVINTRTARLPCIFLFICWARSVAMLQGNGGLTRTIGLSIVRRLDIEDRIQTSLANNTVASAVPDLHKTIADMLKGIKSANRSTLAVRANPLLAGCVLLDHVFTFQLVAEQVAFSSPQFGGFAHIYNALVDRQFIEPLPLMEGVIEAYERWLFKPSRAAVKQGSFLRSYVTSVDTAVDTSGLDSVAAWRSVTAILDELRLFAVSLAYRVLQKNDFSKLSFVSSKTLLNAVSSLCCHEMNELRVQSRDLLKLVDHT